MRRSQDKAQLDIYRGFFCFVLKPEQVRLESALDLRHRFTVAALSLPGIIPTIYLNHFVLVWHLSRYDHLQE